MFFTSGLCVNAFILSIDTLHRFLSIDTLHRYLKHSVQFNSVTQSCPTLCNPMNHTARQASLSITNSQSSLRLTSIKSVMPSSHLILCRPLRLLPPIPPSIRVFSRYLVISENNLHAWQLTDHFSKVFSK